MRTYSEKLKDPRWQKKRLKIMERDGFKCVRCGDSKSSLAVHHAYYVSGRRVFDYPDWSLTTLCKSCHDYLHEEPDWKSREGTRFDTAVQEWEKFMGMLIDSTSEQNRFESLFEIAQLARDLVPLKIIRSAVRESIQKICDLGHLHPQSFYRFSQGRE